MAHAGCTVGIEEVFPDYPVWLLALMLGGAAALLVWTLTKADEPPKGVAVSYPRSRTLACVTMAIAGFLLHGVRRCCGKALLCCRAFPFSTVFDPYLAVDLHCGQ